MRMLSGCRLLAGTIRPQRGAYHNAASLASQLAVALLQFDQEVQARDRVWGLQELLAR